MDLHFLVNVLLLAPLLLHPQDALADALAIALLSLMKLPPIRGLISQERMCNNGLLPTEVIGVIMCPIEQMQLDYMAVRQLAQVQLQFQSGSNKTQK